MLSSFQLQVGIVLIYVLLFVLLTMTIVGGLRSFPQKKRRWRAFETDKLGQFRIPKGLLKLLWIPHEEDSLLEKKQQLAGAGVPINPQIYEILRRSFALVAVVLCVIGYSYTSYTVMIAGVTALAFVLSDAYLLKYGGELRAVRIVKEIYALSNQLLYYSGSRMNLHGKLSRCLPYTRTIRKELLQLMNEWYQDADGALNSFKIRLGTDEAYSFAETLNSLRLHEDESFYEILRQRIGDYKEKLELNKESKKEMVSYLLFVLAGLPILNTFRVFVYPWIAEGQKLFQTLN